MSDAFNNELPSKLLDGKDFHEKLAKILPQAKRSIIFISAYITEAAVLWLCDTAPDKINIEFVCRLSPSDILTGATSIKALKLALQNNMSVSCLHNLHAKIYSVDHKKIFVGSANFTNNGLLIYGRGNLEACVEVSNSPENIDFIENILKSSTSLDMETLEKMENHVSSAKNKTIFDVWPEDVLKDKEGIWVSDFFWGNPRINNDPHDLTLLGITDFDIPPKEIRERLLQARCMRWLLSKLQIQEHKELYFGHISKLLHDDLKDDPTPYRKKVKVLVANLLAYIEEYLGDAIEISVPARRSQRVKLKAENL